MGYFLSIGAIFKNESHALEQWLNHYIRQGVDHFYLVNNESTDNFMEIIERFDCITLFNHPGKHQQLTAYRTLIQPAACRETTYLGIFDLDEFAYARDGSTLRTILESDRFKGFDQIWSPWLLFGSNGHVEQPVDIIASFTRRGLARGPVLGKSIVKTVMLTKLDIHRHFMKPNSLQCKSDGSILSELQSKELAEENSIEKFTIVVNHYKVQSQNFFMQNKATKGSVHNDKHFRNDYSGGLSQFLEYNTHMNAIEDLTLAAVHLTASSE